MITFPKNKYKNIDINIKKGKQQKFHLLPRFFTRMSRIVAMIFLFI
jgi:hypothetical protein